MSRNSAAASPVGREELGRGERVKITPKPGPTEIEDSLNPLIPSPVLWYRGVSAQST